MIDSDGGSTGGVTLARTSFWEAASRHVAEICRGPFAETVRYRSGGGEVAMELTAVVARSQPTVNQNIVREPITVTLPLSEQGPTLIEAGVDLIEVPIRVGEDPTPCRVLAIRSRQPSHWVLEVAA